MSENTEKYWENTGKSWEIPREMPQCLEPARRLLLRNIKNKKTQKQGNTGMLLGQRKINTGVIQGNIENIRKYRILPIISIMLIFNKVPKPCLFSKDFQFSVLKCAITDYFACLFSAYAYFRVCLLKAEYSIGKYWEVTRGERSEPPLSTHWEMLENTGKC